MASRLARPPPIQPQLAALSCGGGKSTALLRNVQACKNTLCKKNKMKQRFMHVPGSFEHRRSHVRGLPGAATAVRCNASLRTPTRELSGSTSDQKALRNSKKRRFQTCTCRRLSRCRRYPTSRAASKIAPRTAPARASLAKLGRKCIRPLLWLLRWPRARRRRLIEK